MDVTSSDGITSAREDAVDYWCSLPFMTNIEGVVSAPTTLLALRERVQSGELPDSTDVWCADLDDWMPLGEVMSEVWGHAEEEEQGRHEEDEEEEMGQEEDEDSGPDFWASLVYRCFSADSPTVTLSDLQKKIQSGEIEDEDCPLQLCGPDGHWEAMSTLGEIMLEYDGFEEALLTAVDVENIEFTLDDDDDPVAHWVLQTFQYRRVDGTESMSLCMGELQELLAANTITQQTLLFCDDFDDFQSVATSTAGNEHLAAAFAMKFTQQLQYQDVAGQVSPALPIAEVRKLVRAEVITDDTLVKGEGMSEYQPLGKVRAEFGLAAWMEPWDDAGGGIDSEELDRKADVQV
jgi:hypothetical protein|eukprot:COSAG01_NODE_3089_length_6601_cov_9.640572_1_plen_348_part_00